MKELTLNGTLMVEGTEKQTVIAGNENGGTFVTSYEDGITAGHYSKLLLIDGQIMMIK